mmetsp:Transcript_13173/g.16758  ORF Transcript_13173/g.16758 Transcript_13173/m.16758 type:complete len:96 (-) Transcript_13173:25-312(-)
MPRVDPVSGEVFPEKNPIMIFDHLVYRDNGQTLQTSREEIYIDLSRAILSAINDSTGENARSRLYGSKFRGDLKFMEAAILKQVVDSQVGQANDM